MHALQKGLKTGIGLKHVNVHVDRLQPSQRLQCRLIRAGISGRPSEQWSKNEPCDDRAKENNDKLIARSHCFAPLTAESVGSRSSGKNPPAWHTGENRILSRRTHSSSAAAVVRHRPLQSRNRVARKVCRIPGDVFPPGRPLAQRLWRG